MKRIHGLTILLLLAFPLFVEGRNRVRTPGGSRRSRTESEEEQKNLRQLVARTNDLHERLREHMDETQGRLQQLSNDVEALHTQMEPRENNHLLKLNAINAKLTHRRRIRECLNAISHSTDFNNSLTIYVDESKKTTVDTLVSLYNLRACILEDGLEWWLRQVLEKAQISGAPKAKLLPTIQPSDSLGEEYSTYGSNSNATCYNLTTMKGNTSAVYLYENSCVRLYASPDCGGENRIFASDRGESFLLNNGVDGFEKVAESVGPCF